MIEAMVVRPITLLLVIVTVFSTGCSRFGFGYGSSQEAGPFTGDGSVGFIDGVVGDTSGVDDLAGFDGGRVDTVGIDSTGVDSAGVDAVVIDSKEPSPDGPSGTADNDTCANPTVVSLAQIAANPIYIPVDTSNAVNDYSIGNCSALPEVVFKLVDVPLGVTITWECEGQGKLTTLISQTAECPGSDHSTVGNPCLAGASIGTSFSTNPSFILACWDPSQGPATLILSQQ